MAKNTLPVNYQDDIMNSAMDGKRRFKMITNTDGTVSFEDVTDYDQVGSNFAAANINATNTAVNESADKNKIIDDLSTIAALTEAGYIAGGLAVKELNDRLNWTGLQFSDVFTVNSGFSINAATIKKQGTKIKALLKFNGSAVTSASGMLSPVTINASYRPTALRQSCDTFVNDSATGYHLIPCSALIAPAGSVTIVTNIASQTIGSITYSWTDTLTLEWDIS